MTNNVVVTDLIPDGCEYVAGSATIDPTINGSELNFDLGDMQSLQQEAITYSLKSADDRASSTVWIDDLESGEDNWDIQLDEGFTIWYLQDEYANSGENAFFTENDNDPSDQFLIQFDPVLMDVANPGMRFFHWYSTYDDGNGNVDGGVVQYSTDGEAWDFCNWKYDAQKMATIRRCRTIPSRSRNSQVLWVIVRASSTRMSILKRTRTKMYRCVSDSVQKKMDSIIITWRCQPVGSWMTSSISICFSIKLMFV